MFIKYWRVACCRDGGLNWSRRHRPHWLLPVSLQYLAQPPSEMSCNVSFGTLASANAQPIKLALATRRNRTQRPAIALQIVRLYLLRPVTFSFIWSHLCYNYKRALIRAHTSTEADKFESEKKLIQSAGFGFRICTNWKLPYLNIVHVGPDIGFLTISSENLISDPDHRFWKIIPTPLVLSVF